MPLLTRIDRYNVVKGRVAEALVEELFLHVGFEVYRFGMENTVPEIRGKLGVSTGSIKTLIQRMPDFLVRSPGGELMLVEVKYRSDGRLDAERAGVGQDYPYDEALFVLVSPGGMKAIRGAELKVGRVISPGDKRLLGFERGLERHAEEIVAFSRFAIRFFRSVEQSTEASAGPRPSF